VFGNQIIKDMEEILEKTEEQLTWEPRLGAKDKAYYEGYNPHPTHCCITHGCKYGYDDCPVYLKEETQEYPCEDCYYESGSYDPKAIHSEYLGLLGRVEAFLKETDQIPDDDDVLEVSVSGDRMVAFYGYDHYTSEDVSFSLKDFKDWVRNNFCKAY
jgi:hypothetical protein